MFRLFFPGKNKAPIVFFLSLMMISHLAISQDTTDPDREAKEEIRQMLLESEAYWYDRPDASLRLSQQAWSQAAETGDSVLITDALNRMGAALYFLGKPDSALIYFRHAYLIGDRRGFKEQTAKAANNIALVFSDKGRYVDALKYLNISLRIDRELKNEDGLAADYLNLGTIYHALKDNNRASDYFTNALGLYQKLNDMDGVLRSYTNLGNVYLQMKVYDTAEDYFSRALQLGRELGNQEMVTSNLNNLGQVYFFRGKYSTALEYYMKVLEEEKDGFNYWSQANTLKNMGEAYERLEIPNEARRNYEKALKLAKKSGSDELTGEILMSLARFYENQNDINTALNYYKSYAAFRDSTLQNLVNQQISHEEDYFELKDKARELNLVQAENELNVLRIKLQKYLIIIFVTLSLLFIMLAGLVWYRLRQNKKRQSLLEEQQQTVLKQKSQLENAYKRLKESKHLYQTLTESIQDALVISQDKKVVFANQELVRLLGYDSMDEIQHLTFRDVIYEEDLETINRNFEARIAGKPAPEEYTFRIKNRSGEIRTVLMHVKPLQYRDKPAVIATLKDITEFQQYEDRLITEKEKAEHATQLKSRFIAVVSHEIRNHLNSLIGITELISDTRLDTEQREYLRIIKLAGANVLRLINQVLDFSRIEARQVSLSPKPFSIRSLVNDVMALQAQKARGKNLGLNRYLDEWLPDYVIGDENLISQILVNFSGNALKFTHKGSVTIRVEKVEPPEDVEGNNMAGNIIVRFSVVDTGIGIEKDKIEELFEPFAQAQAPAGNKGNTGGTGLGLAICKELAELMGGRIGGDSEPGKGSSFWVEIPLKPADTEKGPSSGEKKTGTSAPTTGGKKRILLVEDNPLNQQLALSILERKGYEVVTAINGLEGLEVYAGGKHFDLILMDLQMPVMDGIEASGKIRSFESENNRHATPIIAVTAHPEELENERLRQAGINGHLQKPYTADALINIVQSSISA